MLICDFDYDENEKSFMFTKLNHVELVNDKKKIVTILCVLMNKNVSFLCQPVCCEK